MAFGGGTGVSHAGEERARASVLPAWLSRQAVRRRATARVSASRGEELADRGLGVHSSSLDGLQPAWETLSVPLSTGSLMRGDSVLWWRATNEIGDEKRSPVMRATVMHGAGDVRIETVPDAHL